MVVDQFMDLIVGLLCAAALVSFVLGEYVEGFGAFAFFFLATYPRDSPPHTHIDV
jgi:hypothetical protein